MLKNDGFHHKLNLFLKNIFIPEEPFTTSIPPRCPYYKIIFSIDSRQ